MRGGIWGLTILAVAVVGCGRVAVGSEPGPSSEVRAKIREVEEDVRFARTLVAGRAKATIWDRLAHHRVKAVSIAVIRNYRLEWAKAYGWADYEARRPATTATIFEPGSISKSLHAVGVLRLVEDGRLDLHRDINDYLTGWRFPYDSLAKGKRITLAMLLSHTAGLRVHGFFGYRLGDSLPTLAQTLDGVAPANNDPVRSGFEPGLRFQYSGGGTMISQQVVTDLTGLPYADFQRQWVLGPLGMADSFFDQPPPTSHYSRLATAYDAKGQPIEGKYPVIIEQAAGGLWTTPTDLAKFIINLQLALANRPEARISNATSKVMTTPPLPGAPGLGVFLLDAGGTKYFEHGAGNPGFSGRYVASLSGGNGVVVLINSDAGYDLVGEVINTVAQVYRWPGFEANRAPARPSGPVIQLPDSLRNRYVGSYRDGSSVATITLDGGKLYYQAEASPWEMHFDTPTTFVNAESADEKRFLLDSTGQVTGLVRSVDAKEVGRALRVVVRTPSDSVLARYAGRYLDPDNTVVKVTRKAGSLWLDVEGFERQLRFVSDSEAYTTDDFGLLLRFVADGQGRINLVARSKDREMNVRRVGDND